MEIAPDLNLYKSIMHTRGTHSSAVHQGQLGVFFLKVWTDLHVAALKAMQLGKFTSFLFASLSYSAEFTGIFSLSSSVQNRQYPKQFDNFLAVP